VAKKKKTKSEGKKAKAAKSRKLPKEIAGIKVPKELREAGGKLLAAVRHPLVMDAAAAALMAAAAGLRDTKAEARAGDEGAPRGKRSKRGGELGVILAATAIEGVRRFGDAATRQNKGNGAGAAPKAKS